MTIRTTTSLLLAASLVALATACGSSARQFTYAPEPVRGCRYTGPASGRQLISRFTDTTATVGTATEALDTAAAVLRREGYTVAERAPGAAVVTRAYPSGRVGYPLGVRVDAAGAQQIAFCALWGLRPAALEDLRPEGPDPAHQAAVALYQRIREAVLARR